MMKKESEESARKVTASDVAERAGVSKWTVSRAFTEGASISPLARDKVLQAARELGYRPNLLARSLTKKRTQMVGLVVDELANPNLMPVLDEATRLLQRQGYLSLVLNITSEAGYGSALSLADQFQVDGLLFLGTVLTDELVQLAEEIRHIPLIVLYRNADLPGVQVVSTDGYRAGGEIAELLLAEGYNRLGYMIGPASQSTQLKRVDGFRNGLAQQGIELELILEGGHYERQCGYQAMQGYLAQTAPADRLQALFCENDILAIGALDALREAEVLGSIAIVGFDDIELAGSPSYQLTTYRQPLEILVREAVRRLVEGSAEPRQLLVPGQVVLRSSHSKRQDRA